jgi:hypothetical protein
LSGISAADADPAIATAPSATPQSKSFFMFASSYIHHFETIERLFQIDATRAAV